MSFDVFFQGFSNGEAVRGGGVQMREVLEPFIVREEPDRNLAVIGYGDGSADVYLGDDSVMVNHISGEQPWELLVQGASAADWVIMPPGCPICLTNETQQDDLPAEIREEVAVVATGSDLLSVIRSQ